MKIAILFWFYRYPDLCLERVEQLRRTNHDLPIRPVRRQSGERRSL
jgi:hypothetical protein